MPVGSGSLKNSSCISGDFSSAAPTLYLRRNETPAAQPPLWPHPRRFSRGGSRADFRALRVEANVTTPAHMQQQLSRFMERHFGGGWQQPGAAPSRVLRILVGSGSAHPGGDESYELSIPSDSAQPITITAPTVLGVTWALESLSQLMTLDRDAAGGPQVVIEGTPILVQDKPRFAHRGFFVE